MKLRWDRLGGRMGIGFCVVGFALVFLGWNGAASLDRVPSQFPYLLSGGVAGLCLVLIGVGLMVIENQRKDRASLQAEIAQLREVLERMGSLGASEPVVAVAERHAVQTAGLVVAGPTTYHRPTCRLLDGRENLPAISLQEAIDQGLGPCRACDAAQVAVDDSTAPVEVVGRKRRPARSR